MLLGEDLAAALTRQRVEELGTRHTVDPAVDAALVEQGQRPGHEGVGHGALLQDDRHVARAPRRAQQVEASHGLLGRRETQRLAVEHAHGGARDEGRDRAPGRCASAAASSGQTSCGSQGVRVIAVPGAKFSCRSCSACGSAWVGPVFAGGQTGVTADQDQRPVRFAEARPARAWWPMACRRAAMWPRGAMKAPYDEPTPMA